MREAVRITIEEWAGDNGIFLTDNQIEELAKAIGVCQEMEYVPNRAEELKREEDREISTLKHKVDMLERYLYSKGYNVTAYDSHIERTFMVDYGTFCGSDIEYFR